MKEFKVHFKQTKFLFICGLLILWIIIPIGDYNVGFSANLMALLIWIIGFTYFIISFITNIVKTYKKIESFNYLRLIVIATFTLLFLIILNADGRKFWTNRLLYAETKNLVTLSLFADNSFSVKIIHNMWGRVYQGEYKIDGDTLHLLRDDTADTTSLPFTTKYILNKRNGSILPINKNFKTFNITKPEK